MDFEIKLFNGELWQEHESDVFDFSATLKNIGDHGKAEANGFIAEGDANSLFLLADVDSSTFAQEYLNFLHFIEKRDFRAPSGSFKTMIIKTIEANPIAKGV